MSKALNIHDGLGVIAKDPDKGQLLGYGSTVPAVGAVGWAPGAQFIKTNGTTIGALMYVNVGTKASANFQEAGLSAAIAVSFVYDANVINLPFFVADRPYIALAVNARILVAGTNGGAVTAQIRRVPNNTAVSGGTAIHSGTINLKGTVDQVQEMTMVTTASSINLVKGNSLGFDLTGVATSARGVVSVLLQPL